PNGQKFSFVCLKSIVVSAISTNVLSVSTDHEFNAYFWNFKTHGEIPIGFSGRKLGHHILFYLKHCPVSAWGNVLINNGVLINLIDILRARKLSFATNRKRDVKL